MRVTLARGVADRRLRGGTRGGAGKLRARAAGAGQFGSVAQFRAAIDPLCAVRVAHNWPPRAVTGRAVDDRRCENKTLPPPRLTSFVTIISIERYIVDTYLAYPYAYYET